MPAQICATSFKRLSSIIWHFMTFLTINNYGDPYANHLINVKIIPMLITLLIISSDIQIQKSGNSKQLKSGKKKLKQCNARQYIPETAKYCRGVIIWKEICTHGFRVGVEDFMYQWCRSWRKPKGTWKLCSIYLYNDKVFRTFQHSPG